MFEYQISYGVKNKSDKVNLSNSGKLNLVSEFDKDEPEGSQKIKALIEKQIRYFYPARAWKIEGYFIMSKSEYKEPLVSDMAVRGKK